MSNDQRNAEFSFLDFAKPKPTPGPADHQKNGVASAVVERSDGALLRRKSKSHATDSAGELLAAAVIAALVLILARWFA